MLLYQLGLQQRYNELVQEVKTESKGTIDFDKMYADNIISYGSRDRSASDVEGTFIGDAESELINTITYDYANGYRENETKEEYNARVAEINSKSKDIIDEFAKASKENLDKISTIAMLGAEIDKRMTSTNFTHQNSLSKFGVADNGAENEDRL